MNIPQRNDFKNDVTEDPRIHWWFVVTFTDAIETYLKKRGNTAATRRGILRRIAKNELIPVEDQGKGLVWMGKVSYFEELPSNLS